MRTLFKKIYFKQLNTALTYIYRDKELILKEKEKKLLYTLEAKIQRHKNQSLKDSNKKKWQIRKRVNGSISKAASHRLLDQLINQEENEIESDIDLSIIESPMPDWCAKESLEQLIEKQFKKKIDYGDIFRDCCPRALNLKEYFPK